MFGFVFATDLLPQLGRIADEFQPDAVVHPPVEAASPIVAAERQIPAVTYGFGQLLDDAIEPPNTPTRKAPSGRASMRAPQRVACRRQDKRGQ